MRNSCLSNTYNQYLYVTKLVWHVLSMVITMFHIDCSAIMMSGHVYYHVLLSIQSALLNPPSCVCVLSMNSSNPKNITTCTYMDHERYSLHLNWSWLLITPLGYILYHVRSKSISEQNTEEIKKTCRKVIFITFRLCTSSLFLQVHVLVSEVCSKGQPKFCSEGTSISITQKWLLLIIFFLSNEKSIYHIYCAQVTGCVGLNQPSNN